MSKKWLWTLLLALVGSGMMTGCSDDDPVDEPDVVVPGTDDPDEDLSSGVTDEIYYANNLGKDVLDVFYYWEAEIRQDLDAWDPKTTTDPIAKVREIRYHEGETAVDRWTMMTDDVASLTSGFQGVSTTFGWGVTVYRLGDESLVGVINYIYPDSPAEAAGLKRGDLIVGINGGLITSDNYTDLYYASTVRIQLGELRGNTIHATDVEKTLTAVTMYEDPVLCDTIYEFAGKKVGYLAYMSFDLRSIEKLVEIAKEFKAEGVKELVLDLRYNGGGYVLTEQVMASLFAPQQVVSAGEVFEKDVYNALLTREWGESVTYFKTEFDYTSMDLNQHVSTADANIGLEKIYGLISASTASASESLLSGLMPYMDVQLIGEASHGKYCSGIVLSGEDAYDKNCPAEITNWGVYVMIAIYQNALGETPCMPDGLQPDVAVQDNPFQSYAFGDVNDPMIRAALEAAGRTYDDAAVQTRSLLPVSRTLPLEKPTFGKRILTPDADKLMLVK